MRDAFELTPLLVAAAVGAIIILFLESASATPVTPDQQITSARNGALAGIAVQMTVRLLGVS